MKARIMDQPEDFKKLGINPNHVEKWEDARRDTAEPGHNEVWYFDATMNDGTKFMAGFRPKDITKMSENIDSPNLNTIITTPDGQAKADFQYFTMDESHISTNDECNLKFGKSTVTGDFQSYDIHIEPINGVGCDLHYEALVDPFRQGTGIVTFGDNDEFYHTDLSVPKNKITGTVYYDGSNHEVNGYGYHDHQWMNTNPMNLYHHWLWGRMYTDKYTVYIYDFVAREEYNFKRLPMFGLLDNATGKLVFETDGNVELTNQLEKQTVTGREFPKSSHYIFKNKDGKTVIFDVTWQQELETRDMYNQASSETKKQFDTLKINPIYMRYYSTGGIHFTDSKNNLDVKSTGDMIYEYAYLGQPDKRAQV